MHSSRYSRRDFVKTLAGSATGAVLWAEPALPAARAARTVQRRRRRGEPRKKVALVATEIRKYSHAQHFVDRFLEGYGWQGRHHYPPMDLVSLYVDQTPRGDLSTDRAARHPVTIYPTIAEACTLGTSKLAVDAVVIIGEHGRYPDNAKGQRRYPRYKFFKQVVGVFEDSGRAVPVFNDKHLSTDWKEAAEMVDDSRRLGFPFLAGSSLPVTWRLPSVEMPLGTPLEESVCVCYGGVDSYDFHGYETAQCMSERRAGGESGVKSVHAVRGAKVWDMVESRPVTKQLVLAALARSHTITPPPGYTYPVVSLDWARQASPNAVGSFVEHADGLKTAMILANGLLLDFNYAGKVKESAQSRAGEVISCQMYLPMPPRQTTLADFFSPLVNNIEQMILTGKAPYPIERTLLTTGMTTFGVESLFRGEVEVPTPELAVRYQPSEASTYWRA